MTIPIIAYTIDKIAFSRKSYPTLGPTISTRSTRILAALYFSVKLFLILVPISSSFPSDLSTRTNIWFFEPMLHENDPDLG